jgi:methyl-accepting chemotaxis protein
VEISSKVADSLQQIVARTREVDELMAGIAGASAEQSQGITQVNLAVTEMDKVTQQSAANAEEGASAATELHSQATALKETVEQLRVLVQGAGRVPTSAQPASSRTHAPRSTAALNPAVSSTFHAPSAESHGEGQRILFNEAGPFNARTSSPTGAARDNADAKAFQDF